MTSRSSALHRTGVLLMNRSSASLLSLGAGSDTRNKLSALDVHHAFYTYREDTGRRDVKASLYRFYERDAIYENPVLVATSRVALTEIHTLVNQVLQINVPSPLRVVTRSASRSLFQLSSVWSEVVEISESESFDRSRKVYMEHIVHLLFLPGLHSIEDASEAGGGRGPRTPGPDASSDSLVSSLGLGHPPAKQQALSPPPRPPRIWLHVWRVHSPLSPLHFQLRVTSRLSFNDGGKITRHRDLWDVKDLVLALLPLLKPLFWIGARAVGLVVAAFAWVVLSGSDGRGVDAFGADVTTTDYGTRTEVALPDGVGAGHDGEQAVINALGLTDHTHHTTTDLRARPQRSNSTSVDVP